MILGLNTSTFVTLHVVISLIAIVAGIIVMFGMLGSNRMPGLTAIFLSTTILTSATGFVIPPLVTEKFLPSHLFGFLSLGCWRSPVSRFTAGNFSVRGAGSMC